MTPNEFVEYCRHLCKQPYGIEYKAELETVSILAQGINIVDRPSSDYLETHYVISTFIERNQDTVESLEKINNELGRGGLWDLAQQLTTEFETTYEGVEWGLELDWHDTLEEFLNKKIK